MIQPLHSFLLHLIAACSMIGSIAQSRAAENKFSTDFVRVQRPDSGETLLQTAITSYSKGESSVDLVGAVHIADRAYYEALNDILNDYSAVLFELIGGEVIESERAAAAHQIENRERQDSPLPSLAVLGSMTKSLQDRLQLESQLSVVNYLPDHFIHADLTMSEFLALNQQDGNSISSFMLKQAMQGSNAKSPSTISFLIALLSKNPNRLKLLLIDQLAEADKQLASLDEENLIITQRNDRCIEKLEEALQDGHSKIAIFYGAAHFPHLEKVLLEMGYHRSAQQWLNAWTIPDMKQKPKE
ncbi:hypothetical protein [Rubritalea marina]|uniref:hypothetical protein n=1 Tax=Rubritalea marina TaxID=361055 RepID=UPI00039F01A8|nr:hypothetical protein [Rubritalea marina]